MINAEEIANRWKKDYSWPELTFERNKMDENEIIVGEWLNDYSEKLRKQSHIKFYEPKSYNPMQGNGKLTINRLDSAQSEPKRKVEGYFTYRMGKPINIEGLGVGFEIDLHFETMQETVLKNNKEEIKTLDEKPNIYTVIYFDNADRLYMGGTGSEKEGDSAENRVTQITKPEYEEFTRDGSDADYKYAIEAKKLAEAEKERKAQERKEFNQKTDLEKLKILKPDIADKEIEKIQKYKFRYANKEDFKKITAKYPQISDKIMGNHWLISDEDIDIEVFDFPFSVITNGKINAKIVKTNFYTGLITTNSVKANGLFLHGNSLLLGETKFDLLDFNGHDYPIVHIENPHGCFAYGGSLSSEINNKKNISYYFIGTEPNEYDPDVKGDFRKTLKEQYYKIDMDELKDEIGEKVVEIEDHGEKMSVNDEYEFYYFNFARLDTVAIEKALLAGENIFIGNPKD